MSEEVGRFLSELAHAGLSPGERLILCTFRGDPGAAPQNAWRPHAWRTGDEVLPRRGVNGYATVATFGRAPDGTYRRRTEAFMSGRALMVDDVGTKVPVASVAGAPPTMRVETSPGNEQWWYVLAEPERDAARFDAVIRAFIAGRLLGADPGMAGINRVGRLPGFTNGKPQHDGWLCRAHELAGPRWTVEGLVRAFELRLLGRAEPRPRRLVAVDAEARVHAWGATVAFLRGAGALKRDEPDRAGWIEMTCPWVADHTGGVDNGAALREPAPENDYYGAFRCFHGHCMTKGWRELTDWANDHAAEALEAANSRAQS